MLRAAVLAAVALPGALSFQACGIRTFTPPLPGGGSSSSSFAMRPLGRGACKLSMGTRFTEEDLSRRAGAATGSDEAVKGSPFKLIKALKKPKGTICVAAAVKRKDPVDGELCKLPNDGFVIEELSQGFNNAKVIVGMPTPPGCDFKPVRYCHVAASCAATCCTSRCIRNSTPARGFGELRGH